MTATIPNDINNGVTADADSVMQNFDAVAEAAGISGYNAAGSNVVRGGKCNIATEESRTNAAYGTLTTPDQVSSVVVPTDGWIAVLYSARYKSGTSDCGQAAIFLGSTQVKIPSTTAPAVQETYAPGTAYRHLVTTGGGLYTGTAGTATSEVTTGQIVGSGATSGVGGPCYIFVTAGTYTVSIQFKGAGGSTVTAIERRLWVWTRGF